MSSNNLLQEIMSPSACGENYSMIVIAKTHLNNIPTKLDLASEPTLSGLVLIPSTIEDKIAVSVHAASEIVATGVAFRATPSTHEANDNKNIFSFEATFTKNVVEECTEGLCLYLKNGDDILATFILRKVCKPSRNTVFTVNEQAQGNQQEAPNLFDDLTKTGKNTQTYSTIEIVQVPDGLFQAAWYKKRYIPEADYTAEPLDHFLTTGWLLGNNPNPWFDTKTYIEKNYPNEVTDNCGIDPLSHCLAHLFDDQYIDFTSPKLTMFLERISQYSGDSAEDQPSFTDLCRLSAIFTDLSEESLKDLKAIVDSNLFCLDWYVDSYGVKADCTLSGIYHYIESGEHLNYKPCSYFEPDWYRKTYLLFESLQGMKNAFAHFLRFGLDQGHSLCQACSHQDFITTAPYFVKARCANESDKVRLEEQKYSFAGLSCSDWYGDVLKNFSAPLSHDGTCFTSINDSSSAQITKQGYAYDPNLTLHAKTQNFDPDWYSACRDRKNIHKPDEMSELVHYLLEGRFLGLDPSPYFSSSKYCQINSNEVNTSDAFIHSQLRNEQIGLTVMADLVEVFRSEISGTALFQTDWYLKVNDDLKHSGIDPIEHFVSFGAQEGRKPNPYFYPDWYLKKYPEVAESGLNPLIHFHIHGWNLGMDPSPLFSIKRYLEEYPEITYRNENPLSHFLQTGRYLGYSAFPVDNESYSINSAENLLQDSEDNTVECDVNKPRSDYNSESTSTDDEYLNNRYFGQVDGFRENELFGWFYSGEKFPEVPRILISTPTQQLEVDCNIFRPDLAQISFNHGYCGFSVPVDVSEITSIAVTSHDKKWKLPWNKDLVINGENNSRDVKDKLLGTIRHVKKRHKNTSSKIAVFSTFMPDPSYYSYHKSIIKELQRKGYLVIMIAPVNLDSPHGLDFNSDLYKHADITVVRDNFGYDFGSYGTGLAYALDHYQPDKLVFLNDSIVGTGAGIDFIDSLESNDFWGITESFEHTYHIQSYFFGFSLDNPKVARTVEDFFFGRGFIYTNEKQLVIERFELTMTKFFLRQGIKPNVLLDHASLFAEFTNDDYYNKKEFKAYFHTARRSLRVNSSHFFWREAISLGFPFIKKELLLYNPTNYPRFNQVLYDTIDYERIVKITRELI